MHRALLQRCTASVCSPGWQARRRLVVRSLQQPHREHPSGTSGALESKWSVGAASPSSSVDNPHLGIYINSSFDSGNIEVVSLEDASNIELAIHPDPYCETDNAAHFHWFNFRVTGIRGVPLTLNLVNAGKASFPQAWPGYQAAASYDLEHWFRVPTSYDAEKGVLTIKHTATADACQYAYFAPYTYNRHRLLVARMQSRPGVRLQLLGDTLDGHALDLLRVGKPAEGKRNIWIIARQHPGESQAEWFMEGLLDRLTDPHDAVARTLQRDAVLWLVPNCNPDGTWRGHLRTNSAGVNLNRAWAAPNLEESPEVFYIRDAMDKIGVDMLVDVHGDEELPYCFIAGMEGIPSWDERKKQLQHSFSAAFKRASPDFQTQYGYAVDEPGKANMTICSNQVAERYDCLAVTLEMPFKDTADHPDPVQGWSPERCKRFGASMLPAVLEVIPMLRT